MPIRGLLPLTALCAVLCVTAQAVTPDWAGVYIGPVPSPAGHEARMVLVLQGDGRYHLMHDGRSTQEVYAAQSQGDIAWEDQQRTLRLNGSGQRFRLNGDVSELLNSTNSSVPRHGRLLRQERYSGPEGEWLLDPTTLRAGHPQPGWISFNAIWNLRATAQNGASSLSARMALNCADLTYRLGDVHSFSQPYLRGQAVVASAPNASDAPRDHPAGLVAQVARQHCGR